MQHTLRFIAAGLIAVGALTTACGSGPSGDHTRAGLLVLGIDGMDPEILEELIQAGRMPHFARLRESGDYRLLGTSVPPQSPVAWSNFITGLDPGGHGIFDFIHRDPATLWPYLSTARVEGGEGRELRLGRYRFPLSPPETVLLRDGRAFWEILAEHHVPTTIFKVPANYPPVTAPVLSLSGMGTPDLLGTSGTFSFFTDDATWYGRDLGGGAVYPVEVADFAVEASLRGPDNLFIHQDEDSAPPPSLAPFTVHVDPEHPAVRVELQGQKAVLTTGEWSEWMVAEFELVPGLVRTTGICRFYLMEVRPHFRLYVTPININPKEPAQPISTPGTYAADLCEEVGFFYTQGMPEDTKALTGGVFDDRDFITQAGMVLAERERQFDHVLGNWDQKGLLFFYFSSVDQQCHVLWRHTDPEHPAYPEHETARHPEALRRTYEAMDRALGRAMDKLDPAVTMMVMSDHGFAPFRRAVHLNRWLADEGYLVLKKNAPVAGSNPDIFSHVDWSRTRAYALGLNPLYINVRGRERWGLVDPRQRLALVEEIRGKLLALRDAGTGEPMITRVYTREDVYHGPHARSAPDLIVGYAPGYRASWETSLGQVPATLVVDNEEEWSGDHCMDHTAVPGILLANRPIFHPSPELTDLTPTILDVFGVPQPEAMRGRSIFARPEKVRDPEGGT